MATYTSLFSGSSGNCSVISHQGKHILVDIGKNCKQVCLALDSLNINIKDIQAILVTHEHKDHVGALKVFSKKYKIPVYATSATADYLIEYNLVNEQTEVFSIEGRGEDIDDFYVQAFRTSHDSVDCCGYQITTKDNKILSIATDLGYVSDEVYNSLKQADMVVLEANYDENMLMLGEYPYHLKIRIKSTRGHLCNEETGAVISKLLNEQKSPKKFALCHLSNENNSPQLALDTVVSKIFENHQNIHNEIENKNVLITANKRNSVSNTIEF